MLVVGCQWSVVSGQWSVVSDQWCRGEAFAPKYLAIIDKITTQMLLLGRRSANALTMVSGQLSND